MSRIANQVKLAALAVAVVAALSILEPVRAYPQVSGATISGTVTDKSGTAIPKAQVSIINDATAVTMDVVANSEGLYTAPNLLPGTYTVTVSAPGFETQVRKAITLAVGAQQALKTVLPVGQATETVEAVSAVPTVELDTSTISANVSAATMRELPLNGRGWVQLATLQPGVAQVRTQEEVTQVGAHARGLGTQLSIDGNRPTQNSYRLDGMVINDYSNAGPGSVLGQSLGVDAIQEFTVLTSNYAAEYGYTSGGVINAITRSGSNQFHGSAYEFLRNSALDAANFFDNANDLKKAPFRRNQFGGSGGGPIRKDRLFVFGDYEELRQNLGIGHVAFTPSADARSGILYNPDGTTTILKVDPEIAKYFSFFPLPNAGLIAPGNTGNYAFSGQQVVPEDYWTTRVDDQISDKDSMNASWYSDHSTFTQPDALNQVQDGFVVMRTGGVMEENHIFSAVTTNSFRVGWNRTTGFGTLTPSAIDPAAADASLGMVPGFYAPKISVPGLTGFSGGLKGQAVQEYTAQAFQMYDDAFHTVGTHTLKFGFAFIRVQNNIFAPFTQDGTVSFGSLSDFLQNIPFQATATPSSSATTPHNLRSSVFGGYLQDDWRFRSNLTFNLGLRYEMETNPTEIQGKVANLPTIYSAPGQYNKVFFTQNPTLRNFEPRLGFAWDPFHDGKTAIRGGFGLFDALPLPYELIINTAQTSPYHVSGLANNPPQGSFPSGIYALVSSPPTTAQTYNYVEPSPKRNYTLQLNLNLQRQMTINTTVSVAYAGSRTLHNPFQVDDSNTVLPALTSAGYLWPNPVGSGTLLNPAVAGVQTTMWQSRASYNALQAQVNKKLSRGVELQVAYTWSKTMDTSPGSFAGDNFAGDWSPTIPWWNLSLDKGLSDFNVGQNLVVNGLWQAPAPKILPGRAGWMLRGWEFGGIFELSGGVPLWPMMGTPDGDPLGQLNTEPIDLPDRMNGPGCSSLSNPGNPNAYIKAQCLEVPIAPNPAFYSAHCDQNFGTAPQCFNLLGNLGRNTVIGPGLANLDIVMVKDNHIRTFREKDFDIQFRGEFFNILNRANFAPPVNNLEVFDHLGNPVPGFGQITGTQTPARDIQLAIKVIW